MKKDILLKAEENISKGWDFIFEKLYYPKTHMIYDCLYGNSIEETIADFPTPEEIAASFPNPCGWGTGMEDSTLNLATMLEAVENRYKATKDPEMKKYFDMMCEGLIITGTAAPEKGFIARCVAPADGKSVYIDSSRDQYTHWIFAGHIILQSELSSEEQKQKVREVLVDIARKAERDVKPETGGYLMRLDGKPGRVTQYDSTELHPHEYHRYPMIYAAAFEASGDAHWLERYRECRDRFFEPVETGFYNQAFVDRIIKYGYAYGIYQAQYSFRLLYDIEIEEDSRERFLKLMQRMCELGDIYFDNAYKKIDILRIEHPDYTPWRKVDALFECFFHGLGYYVPKTFNNPNPEIEESRAAMRNAGEVMIIKNLCPGYVISETDKQKFVEIINVSNFNNIKSYWPVVLCGAWWGMKANKEN